MLFSFFVMGFVDVVGVATSYVKADFSLSDRIANLLPMMVFLWFAVCSLPTGVLMGRIGRKRTVMASAAVTFVAMLLPLADYSFPVVLTAFALLGIGNTMLQVSLNPLLADVAGEARATSMLTLGQFIKAVCSMLGPVLVGVAAGVWGNWRLIFPLYALITLLSWLWMARLKVDESHSEPVGARGVRTLLTDGYILMLLSVIVLSVGFEIGLMTAVPKYLSERCSLPLDRAAMGCSLYYLARTAGTFRRCGGPFAHLFAPLPDGLDAAGPRRAGTLHDGSRCDGALRRTLRVGTLLRQRLRHCLLGGPQVGSGTCQRGLGADDHGCGRRCAAASPHGRRGRPERSVGQPVRPGRRAALHACRLPETEKLTDKNYPI